MLYTQNEEAITLVYKNINSFYLQKSWRNGRMIESVKYCYDWHHVEIYSEPCFFVLILCETDAGPLSQPKGHHPQLAQDKVTCLISWLLSLTDCWGEKLLSLNIFWRSHISFQFPTDVFHKAFLLSLVYLKTQLHVLFFFFF